MDPERERTIKAGDKEYTLVFGNRALRLLEKQLGRPFGTVIAAFQDMQASEGSGIDLSKLSWSDLTVMFWAGLQSHHPTLTLDDVDNILDEAGGLVAQMQPMTEALTAAFGAGEGTAQGNGIAAPVDGTGELTTSTRSRRG